MAMQITWISAECLKIGGMAQVVQKYMGKAASGAPGEISRVVFLQHNPNHKILFAMKHLITRSFGSAIAASGLLLSLPCLAQEEPNRQPIPEEKPVTRDGTISELKVDKITITGGTSAEPLRFTYSKGTKYVDERGLPVSVTSLKLGVPVTIHYAAVGDNMVANKIVVKRTSTVPNAISDTTLVTATGTISEFGPERIVVSTDSSSEPFSYSLTKKTTFVDESGAVVSTQTIKSGLPVTVYYTKAGNNIIASKVVVTKVTPTPAGITGTTATTTMGTISELTPEALSIRTETSKEPLRYKFTKTTTYVDESGAPLSAELVKTGLPVTVHYTTSGDSRVATKVVVRKKNTSVTPLPPVPKN